MSGEIRVDWRTSVSLVGTVVKYLSGTLLIPLAVALYYGNGVFTFVLSIAITAVIGLTLERVEPEPDLGAREGFLMVALTWLVVAFVGTIPYLIAGFGTESTLAQPMNALFESMSGFTTTGATVMGHISLEHHSHAILLWRQLTQWLGGMGIVVLAIAILPELSVGGAQLMDTEVPGPGFEKLTPRIAETARGLWLAYVGLTVVEMVALYALHLLGLAPDMTVFNAIAHPLTTMSTGGFSPEARSIEAFSAAVQWVIIPFMVVAGTNFTLLWHVLNGEPKRLVHDTETRAYLGVLAVFTAIVAGLFFTGLGIETVPTEVAPLVGEIENSLRHALFNVVSIVTTTGFASMAFNTWSDPVQYVILIAIFVGGSAGSTAGAIKIVRWVVIYKSLRRELFSLVHPSAVSPVRLGGQAIDERAIRGMYSFTLLYFVVFFVGSGLLLVDAWRVGYHVSAFETMSAAATTLGNVGPGFGSLGPMNGFLKFPRSSKLVMVILMWVGRLEILPVLVILTPSYWRT